MFLSEEQLKGNINTVDRQLMYNIREEMRRSNELLNKLLNGFNREEKVQITESGTETSCKYCGGTHKNRQQMAACAKKKKKEG